MQRILGLIFLSMFAASAHAEDRALLVQRASSSDELTKLYQIEFGTKPPTVDLRGWVFKDAASGEFTGFDLAFPAYRSSPRFCRQQTLVLRYDSSISGASSDRIWPYSERDMATYVKGRPRYLSIRHFIAEATPNEDCSTLADDNWIALEFEHLSDDEFAKRGDALRKLLVSLTPSELARIQVAMPSGRKLNWNELKETDLAKVIGIGTIDFPLAKSPQCRSYAYYVRRRTLNEFLVLQPCGPLENPLGAFAAAIETIG